MQPINMMEAPVKRLRHKYKACPVEYDGHKFPSKKEGAYYLNLKMLQRQGDVVFFLMQVPFHLPGGIVYRVDFQIFWANGTVDFVDVKGYDTPVSKLKRDQIETLYSPVRIRIV